MALHLLLAEMINIPHAPEVTAIVLMIGESCSYSKPVKLLLFLRLTLGLLPAIVNVHHELMIAVHHPPAMEVCFALYDLFEIV